MVATESRGQATASLTLTNLHQLHKEPQIKLGLQRKQPLNSQHHPPQAAAPPSSWATE
jgi:hypothetical protein